MPYDKDGNYYEIDPYTGMVRPPQTRSGATYGDAISKGGGLFGSPIQPGMARHMMGAPQTQLPQQSVPSWYDFGVRDAATGGGIQIPRIPTSALQYTPGQDIYQVGSDSPIRQDANFAFGDPNVASQYGLWGNLSSGNNNFDSYYDPNNPNSFQARVKTGDKEGTAVNFSREGDYWVPQQSSVQPFGWDTSAGAEPLAMIGAVGLGGPAAYAGLTGLAGAGLLGSGGAGASAVPGATANSLWPGLASAGGGGVPGGYAGAIGTGGAGWASAPAVGSAVAPWLSGSQVGTGGLPVSTAGGVTSAGGVGAGLGGMAPSASTIAGGAKSIADLFGGGNNTGSGVGGLIGAGLGYLDAKNQPDSITVRNEIDPRLGEAFYGPGGLLQEAQSIYGQQQGQPNPLTQAGQQISGMANTLPNWGALVDQAKGQWDANPWINQQQASITDTATRNLMENVLPGIGSNANMAGGYGGSRQGIAQANSISNLNRDLGVGLSNLATNAWESGQNRALSSAGQAGQYGLGNQAQQANLLNQGAQLQVGAPWANFNQLSNFTRGLPGNSSTTTPLFNNIYGNMLGGASLGSQVGGGTDWSWLGDVGGGIADWFKNWGK